jgi:hypothetical protein
MLKINLLPAYIHERKKIRATWATMLALLGALTAGLIAYQGSLISQEQRLAEEVTMKEQKAQQVQKLVSDAAAERDKIKPIEGKVTFIKDILAFNKVRPDLFQRVSEYTFKGIRYNQMQAEGNVLTIQAFAPDLSSAGRYLIYMQGNPDLATVNISAVPGYPPGNQNEGSTFGGTTDTGSGGYGGAAGTGYGPPGMSGPGGPPGSPGGGYGAPGGGYGPPGGAISGPGAPPGGGPGGMGYGGPPGAGGPGGYPGAPGGDTGTAEGQLPGYTAALGQDGGVWGGRWFSTRNRLIPDRSDPTQYPTGFPFSVTATLVKPINRPIYGQTTDQTTDTSGGYGGYPGAGGGYGPPGMPGGYGPPGGPGGAPNGP